MSRRLCTVRDPAACPRLACLSTDQSVKPEYARCVVSKSTHKPKMMRPTCIHCRDEVAGCSQQAYDQLSLAEAQKMMFLSSSKQMEEYAMEVCIDCSCIHTVSLSCARCTAISVLFISHLSSSLSLEAAAGHILQQTSKPVQLRITTLLSRTTVMHNPAGNLCCRVSAAHNTWDLVS